MSYSQNLEEQYILDYFKNSPPSKYLEIGSFDPFVFSNTRALFELGWSGVLIEPSPKCMGKLKKEYANEPRIKLIEAAITASDGVVEFYEESHGYAVSSVDNEHKKKWESDSNFSYNHIQVKTISMKSLIEEYGNGVDFISIDVEGTNYNLFKLIPDSFFETVKCLCIEHDNFVEKINEKLIPFGFKQLYLNGENLIIGK